MYSSQCMLSCKIQDKTQPTRISTVDDTSISTSRKGQSAALKPLTVIWTRTPHIILISSVPSYTEESSAPGYMKPQITHCGSITT